MSRSARLLLAFAAVLASALVALIGIRVMGTLRSPRGTVRVIRRPSAPSRVAEPAADVPRAAVPRNLAPLATVTASSVQENGPFGAGVADGVVDNREWVAEDETAGAWIRLDWPTPVAVMEIELYDRPSPAENVLGGTLTFDDGSMIAVPALPPAGSPWRVSFPPKRVRSLMFRVDLAQGSTAGLAEIMVYGTPDQ